MAGEKTSGGYRGRVPIAEFVPIDDAARQSMLRRDTAPTLDAVFAARAGHQSLRAAANELVRQGVTDQSEVARVLGDST